MGRPKKVSNERFINAIGGSFGNKREIARRLGINRETVSIYIDNSPEISAAYEQEKESAIDYVESRLMAGIKNGDPESIRFFLRTIGRRRGYNERMELSGEGGGAIVVKIDADDARG